MENASFAGEVDGLLHGLLQASGFSVTHTVACTAPGPSGSITVEFEGPDAGLLTARDGELLLAIEHIAAKAMRLEPGEQDRLSFDAGGWKANRDRKLTESADAALAQVRASGLPFAFPPMSSHERRLLHLALVNSGLSTASEGDGAMRHLVLKPIH